VLRITMGFSTLGLFSVQTKGNASASWPVGIGIQPASPSSVPSACAVAPTSRCEHTTEK